MTVVVVASLSLLVAAVGVSVLGVLLADDAFDRMHFLAPATLVGGPALVVATAAGQGFGIAAGRTALVVLICVVAGPVLTHATARAGLARGDASLVREEREP